MTTLDRIQPREAAEPVNIRLPIYLDYQATTPVDPRVLDAMLPYFREKFGNPHSRSHAFGQESEEACEKARAQIAALIGAEAREIVFTSGATESNNLALAGAARFHRPRKDHVVTVVTEHKCVIETARMLEREGFRVTFLPVARDGLIDLDELAAALDEKTAVVSVMAVNNEIGVIQPVAEIGALCRERGILFHSDCAQAAGKIPLDVNALKIDLMSLSGHKIYGPKGIGALYVRRRPRARLEPMIQGGGQERGLRSGTLPTPLCVGMGEACAIAAREMAEEEPRIRRLRDKLYVAIRAAIPDVIVNGDLERRVAGNLNLSFPGIDADELMLAVPELALSSGSACTSTSIEPSYVVRALGAGDEIASASVRLCVGRFTSEAEIDYAIDVLIAQVRRLRDGAGAERADG